MTIVERRKRKVERRTSNDTPRAAELYGEQRSKTSNVERGTRNGVVKLES